MGILSPNGSWYIMLILRFAVFPVSETGITLIARPRHHVVSGRSRTAISHSLTNGAHSGIYSSLSSNVQKLKESIFDHFLKHFVVSSLKTVQNQTKSTLFKALPAQQSNRTEVIKKLNAPAVNER